MKITFIYNHESPEGDDIPLTVTGNVSPGSRGDFYEPPYGPEFEPDRIEDANGVEFIPDVRTMHAIEEAAFEAANNLCERYESEF